MKVGGVEEEWVRRAGFGGGEREDSRNCKRLDLCLLVVTSDFGTTSNFGTSLLVVTSLLTST